MFDLLVWLIKLPFVLLGLVLTIVFTAIGALLSIVGAIVGGLWTALAFGVACAFLIWLMVKLMEDRETTAAQ